MTSFVRSCPNCQKEIEISFKCSGCEANIFNQFLPGGKDSPGKLLDMCRALHAEETALLNLLNTGNYGRGELTFFCTTQPCNLCANKIVASGIKRVVFDEPYTMKESVEILENGKINITRFQGIKSTAYFKLYK